MLACQRRSPPRPSGRGRGRRFPLGLSLPLGETHVKDIVFATLVRGMEILRAEGVYPASLTGHGGLFKTKGVAERILSEMLGIPVTTCASAGEGGAWGVARLATLRSKCP